MPDVVVSGIGPFACFDVEPGPVADPQPEAARTLPTPLPTTAYSTTITSLFPHQAKDYAVNFAAYIVDAARPRAQLGRVVRRVARRVSRRRARAPDPDEPEPPLGRLLDALAGLLGGGLR